MEFGFDLADLCSQFVGQIFCSLIEERRFT